MSKVATLSLDHKGKWTAVFAGKILASSPNKEYVMGNIRNGRCVKANNVGVTDVVEIGKTAVCQVTGREQKVDKFGINERFDFLTDFVHMVTDRVSASVLVTGEGGLGKTFTVLEALESAGIRNAADLIDFGTDSSVSMAESRKVYTIVKGYSTAKGLYRTLYENRNRLVIFDDCDSVLQDATALNLLKGALDSYERRIITWNAESSFGGESDLPKSFEFTGGVIFISNKQIFKIDQAVRSRAICVDLSMTTPQKLERMSVIIKSPKFLPDYDMATKEVALDFLGEMQNEAREISFRTLIAVTKVAGRGDSWKRRAEYLLTAV